MLKVSYRKQQSLSRRIWGSPPQAENFGDLSLKNEDFVTINKGDEIHLIFSEEDPARWSKKQNLLIKKADERR